MRVFFYKYVEPLETLNFQNYIFHTKLKIAEKV